MDIMRTAFTDMDIGIIIELSLWYQQRRVRSMAPSSGA
jgi:hypothetical protein